MGDLADTIKAMLAERDHQRAAGASETELARNMEQSLRAALPQERPWKYLCRECDDTGLIIRTCRRGQRCDGIASRIDSSQDRPGKYTRLCAKAPDSDYEHEYGEPCWCNAGNRFKARPQSEIDPVQEATKAPKKPTRWGR